MQSHHVFEIWKLLFERPFPMSPVIVMQFRESFMDHMLTLLQTNFTLPVLEYLAFASQVDAECFVYFLQNLVPKIQMPCHRSVYRPLIEIVKKISPEIMKSMPSVSALLGAASLIEGLSVDEMDEILALETST